MPPAPGARAAAREEKPLTMSHPHRPSRRLAAVPAAAAAAIAAALLLLPAPPAAAQGKKPTLAECPGRQARRCLADALKVLEQDEPKPPALAKAVRQLQAACEAGNLAGACDELGALHEYGTGVSADPGVAANLYGRACEGGSGAGCRHLATLHNLGKGVARDATLAAQLLGRACTSGDGVGCATLGHLHLSGSGGVQKDVETAVKWFREGCERGHAPSCLSAAQVYAAGTGLEKSEADATRFYAEACRLGEKTACPRK